MHVEIGPVGVDTAIAWIAYGRRVLRHLTDQDLPVTSLERLHHLLDEFDARAADGEPFHWTTDTSPEEVEFLMKGLFEIGLAAEREHEAGRLPLRPPEADEFHVIVVQQVLAAVEMEGPAFAQFVEGLRADWGVAGQS